MESVRSPLPPTLLEYAQRAALLAALWWACVEGRNDTWAMGLPVVLLAAWMSIRLHPARAWRVRPWPTLRLLGYFISRSVAGGIDVARRALHPRMPLAPAMVQYRLRLQHTAAQVLLADMMSLLPGSLSAQIDADTVCLHVLDVEMPVATMLAEMEERIAAVFALELEPRHRENA